VQITFEFFGVLERLAGASALQLELPPDSRTVEDALAALAQRLPQLSEDLPRSACALGERLVLRREALAAGARLALLPPVAGG
jgi:molybdopterin synthase sulfur carrier subunit